MKAQIDHPKKMAPWVQWGLILILSLIWGSSFILIKKGLVSFNAGQLASLRIALTSLTFIPLFIYHFKNVDWSKIKYFLVVGFLGSFIPAFLFAYAQTKVSSSLAGVFNSTVPLFTLLLGILFFRTAVVWIKILGVLLGLAGAILLLLKGGESGGANLYAGFIILASLCYATNLNTISTYLKEVNPIITSAVSFMIIGIPASIYLLNSGFIEVLQTDETAWLSLGYISILAFFGTFIGSILFFKLVVNTNALFASLVSYTMPLVALGWGLLDGEIITIYHLAGMLLILIGVYLSKK